MTNALIPPCRSTACLLLLVALGCGSETPLAPARGEGEVRLSTATSGLDRPGGYVVALQGPDLDAGPSRPRAIAANGMVLWQQLPPGRYRLTMSDLPQHCSMAEESPLEVQVESGRTLSLRFSISCIAATGVLEVSTLVTGLPEGRLRVAVEGSQQRVQQAVANGITSLPGLVAGSYQVRVEGWESGACTVSGDNPRAIELAEGTATRRDTVRTTFDVRCAAGGFMPTGAMTTARAGHSATLLPTGKVLITGGVGEGFHPLRTAELYDLATRSFSPTANMIGVAGRHTAVRLADGRVLIAGGGRAELYDPASGTFAATGSPLLSGAGWRGAAALLPDGRVLIAEDLNAEIYDPASGTFALTEAYADQAPVQVDVATLLQDGTVLVAGYAAGSAYGTTQIFDPRTGRFSLTGPRRAWDVVSTATQLEDGTVLLVEGNDSNLADDVELYEPVSGSFTHIGLTGEVHEFAAAVRLQDGSVLIAGGQTAWGDGNFIAERFLPATRSFTVAGRMTIGRHSNTATLLADGTVLITGGWSDWDIPVSSAEIYRPPF